MQECREREVFDAVAAWAYGSEALGSDSLAQSIADVEGLLLLIRFPLMTPAELQVILLAVLMRFERYQDLILQTFCISDWYISVAKALSYLRAASK